MWSINSETCSNKRQEVQHERRAHPSRSRSSDGRNLERGGLPGVRTFVENNPRLSGIPQWVIEYLIDRVEKLEAEVARLKEGAA